MKQRTANSSLHQLLGLRLLSAYRLRGFIIKFNFVVLLWFVIAVTTSESWGLCKSFFEYRENTTISLKEIFLANENNKYS